MAEWQIKARYTALIAYCNFKAHQAGRSFGEFPAFIEKHLTRAALVLVNHLLHLLFVAANRS